MLITGKEYLQSIRDGRVIYIGKERVKDQTTHPAFANGARTYAALFDMKSDPALRDAMTFEEGGERYSMYYLQPRSQEDLRRRNRAHRKIADFCFGLMGRTPDAFAGNLTGLSLKPEVFDSEPGGSRNNLLAIYQHVRRNARREVRRSDRHDFAGRVADHNWLLDHHKPSNKHRQDQQL
jgi:4-hydroxyphenylacetate 3-monooxygenase